MKKLLLVSLFGDPLSTNNSRLNNIYEYAIAEKTIVTADFNHLKKEYIKRNWFKNVDFIHVPAYKKNLSIKRIYSHLCFAVRLKTYLNKLKEKPDIIYCAMPSSTAAFVCGVYCKKNNIQYIIDVIDLWPDSLIPINRIYMFLKPFLYLWKRITIRAYKNANIILGESIKYTEIASSYNQEAKAYPLYLGVDLEQINLLKSQSSINLIRPENQIWICYGGNLGNSYDFDVLLNAIKKVHDICDYKMLFIGGGEKENYIKRKIDEYKLNAIVTGRISYADYLKYLSYCDIAINIFKEGTLVVHSYKFNDYVASGLFIMNNLIGETADMVDQYKIGKNFNHSNNTLNIVLKDVCSNWHIYKRYKDNNMRLIKELMDKKVIYTEVLSQII